MNSDIAVKQLKKLKVEPYDMVVVNLYPFSENVKKKLTLKEMIENIDIGGPAAVRAAAKNFQSIIAVCDPKDYLKVLKLLKFDVTRRVKDLSPEEINTITGKIEEFPTEGDLVRRVKANINRLQAIGSYRGIRHIRRLPSRGQRTKTNSRTIRGNKKNLAISGKKPAEQKT